MRVTIPSFTRLIRTATCLPLSFVESATAGRRTDEFLVSSLAGARTSVPLAYSQVGLCPAFLVRANSGSRYCTWLSQIQRWWRQPLARLRPLFWHLPARNLLMQQRGGSLASGVASGASI